MSLLTFSIADFFVSKSLGIIDTEGLKIIVIIIIIIIIIIHANYRTLRGMS